MKQEVPYNFSEIEKIFKQWSQDFCEQEKWHCAICLNAARSIVRRLASTSKNETGFDILLPEQVETLEIVKSLAVKRLRHCEKSTEDLVSIADGGLFDLYIMSTRNLAEEARAILEWCDEFGLDIGRNPGPFPPAINWSPF